MKKSAPTTTPLTYVVLLRGVMPTGKNRVPMARLREVLVEAGFGNVRTYIQSGNALVDSVLKASEVEVEVGKAIREKIGPALAVIARTPEQLEKALDDCPFERGLADRVFYSFFAAPPNEEKLKALLAQDFLPDRLVSSGAGGMYALVPGVYTRSKLNNNSLEKRLGVAATTRNGNTLRALLALARK